MTMILLQLPVIAGVFLSLSLLWTPVTCREFLLPFVLSNNTCSIPKHFQPICTCITKYNISNYENLCRSHEAFSECINTQLFSGETSFLDSMYQEQKHYLVHDRLKYICEIFEDTKPELEKCSYEPHAVICDGVFSSIVNRNASFKEIEACKLSEDYGNCYWGVQCSAKVKHLLVNTAQVFSPYTCAKHGRAVSQTCVRLTRAFYPEGLKEKEQCVDSVYTMTECFKREHLDLSENPEDIIASRELDLDRQIDFGTFRCDLIEERDHQCSSTKGPAQRQCFIQYLKDIDGLEARVNRSETVRTDEICRIYKNVTQCMTTLFTECPVESVFFNSILCSAMPTSCYCPVNIVAERLARSSLATPSASISYITLPLSFILTYTWYS